MQAFFQTLLTDTIQHAVPTGVRDGYGVPTVATAVARPARIDWTARRFVTATGEERVSRAIAYLDWNFDLELNHQLTLPDGTTPKIQRLERHADERGRQDHYKVFF